MTTNAQAALQAAATYHDAELVTPEQLMAQASEFKTWLDAQDDADREAMRKSKDGRSNAEKLSGTRDARPKGSGNMDGVTDTRGVRDPRIVKGDARVIAKGMEL